MRKLNLRVSRGSSSSMLINGVAQFGLGVVGLANDVCLKLPGVVLNEGSNYISAGVKKLSEVSESKFIKYKTPKSYGTFLTEEGKDDARLKMYLRGAIPLSELPVVRVVEEQLSNVSGAISERVAYVKSALARQKEFAGEVNVDESTGEIIIIK